MYTINGLMSVFGSWKRAAVILLALLIIGAAVFALRGPYTSNFLKRFLLREVRTATGRQVIAETLYVNIFPPFVGAKGIKAFDETGGKVFTAEAAKVYPGLSSLLRGEVQLRVFLDRPEVWANAASIEDIRENLKNYSGRRKKTIRFKVKTAEIRAGGFAVHDRAGNLFTGKGVNADVNFRDGAEVAFRAGEITVSVRHWPTVRVVLEGTALVKEDGIDIKRLRAESFGSILNGTGLYRPEGKSAFMAEAELLVGTVKRLFGLKGSGEGTLRASGDINMNGFGEPALDLDLKGSFHLETLMELLGATSPSDIGAKTEGPLKGWIDFRGNISGKVSDLKGRADARMRRGNIFGVGSDDLRCEVLYGKGVMDLRRGRADLYGGKADFEARLRIPDITPYEVSVNFRGVESTPLLGLLDLAWFEFPNGKVSGELRTSGEEFNPGGRFSYEAVETLNRPTGRVKHMEGWFDVNGPLITLSSISVETGLSTVSLNGTVDLDSEAIDLQASVKTSDIEDLTAPHFEGLHGEGEFGVAVSGVFNDPSFDVGLMARGARLDDYALGKAEGRFSYRKDLLEIASLSAVGHTLKGKIGFKDAKEIMDFGNPDYDIEAGFADADLKGLLTVLGLDLPIEGMHTTTASIKGQGPVFTGKSEVTGARLYSLPVSSASFGFTYENGEFTLKDGLLKEGDSRLRIEGMASWKGDFRLKADSEEIYLRDILPEGIPVDYSASLSVEGKGTFDKPDIVLKGGLAEGALKGRPIGGGSITASIEGDGFVIDLGLLDGRVALKGKALLSGEMPWSADLKMGAGSYSFLLALLKTPPEDVFLNMEGAAVLRGTKDLFEADATISELNAVAFGEVFSNYTPLKFSVSGRRVSFEKVLLRSGQSFFAVGGSVEGGRNYDLSADGRASLGPFKALIGKIESIKGEADFLIRLRGPWQRPLINGSFGITGGALALKGFPQHLTAVNGYFYAEGDKVVIQRLGAKFGGGDVVMTGAVYLEGWRPERVYLDAALENITVSPAKDFTANISGNLVVKGTPEAHGIAGELSINRARYRKRVEWKSWLMSARKKELPKTATWVDRINLNVKVYGDENITIDNNIARASLKTEMVVRGTVGNPLFFGRVEAKEGKVFFRNNEFRIVSATADYADPRSPYFVIVAETFAKGYHLWLSLDGHTDRFDLTLRSDPPLAEVEILGLLTVGDFGEDLHGLEGSITAAEAASFLTGKYQDVIEERLKDITGLDRVQIDPYVSKSTGAVVPRLTVAKKLLGEKLFVTYSSTVGTSEEQVLNLEYILSGNVSLVGVRDERGSLGGDIKFRFRFE